MTRAARFAIVRTIVAAKIANSRVVLLRAAREIADEACEKFTAGGGEPSLMGRFGGGAGDVHR